ncbi:LPXTG cell wall anchor domain-containing protein [Streptomyces sp. NBC_01235]|uniref:LPXTG cell wall anchor domain-containing protein n=1 Tax=Streptomyces sp. NBC_01235 TaxID=2903788 RepID=UPI002E0F861C|nr:LPXTG cell wall anchor domain-containing protein [Streptomyces sp. NBC_01235]
MSARSVAARRIRTVAATAVVTAVAGTAFVPATAVAADKAGEHALRMTLGAPTPDAPLKRGGSTESMILTVANSSDKAQEFSAWMPGEPNGPSPVLKDSIVFDVTAVDAPATKSAIGHQDGFFQGLFFPASGNASSTFSVPAKTEFTWKVTVGLGASYPTNDGDFTLHAGRLVGDIDDAPARNTVVFKTDPQIKPGKLNQAWVRNDNAVARPGRRAGLLLETRADGPGEFPAELHRTVSAKGFRQGAGHPDFILEAKIDGKIVKLKESDESEWELPDLPKGFGAASGLAIIDLYLSLGEHSDIKKDTAVPLESLISMDDSGYFNAITTKVTAGPAKTTPSSPSATPSATPSTPASQSPSASATPSASESTSAATTTGGTTGGTTTTSATGSLANTGSGSGLYGSLAAVLLAVGGAAAWFGTRRRRTARV